MKNANVGKEGRGEEGRSSRGGKKGKSKQVSRSETPLDKFISKRKIALGHRVDLSDMGGMEIIPTLFHDIGWGSLLIVNELFYHMMLYEFYANMQRGKFYEFYNMTTQSSSTKCLPYGCFFTKVFQHFKITFFGLNDHIGIGKIYNQNTFKRLEFSRNEDGRLIRVGQEKDSENSKEEEKDEGNEPENMDEDEINEEEIRMEMRSKRRQEKMEKDSSSVDMGQESCVGVAPVLVKDRGMPDKRRAHWALDELIMPDHRV
ncbi:hypothetical protein M9H77_31601 [Catharanthus roseus]|uniref:Uncharacterized protein n=1 Tax=Catharanthus roseus TaxID=4058 RepID=A0ACC0A0W8_CATRO|nr:hypothetical protein M9H77_31601 [Catharanthus roseus]